MLRFFLPILAGVILLPCGYASTSTDKTEDWAVFDLDRLFSGQLQLMGRTQREVLEVIGDPKAVIRDKKDGRITLSYPGFYELIFENDILIVVRSPKRVILLRSSDNFRLSGE